MKKKKRIIQRRLLIYSAVEGKGEESLITWIQELSNQENLYIHLKCHVLNGGGYRSMLNNAVSDRKRKGFQNVKSILLVDGDRDKHDDWSIEKFKEEATKQKFDVCILTPNLEGLFVSMLSKKEKKQLSTTEVKNKLRKSWPNYRKPEDAATLSMKFTLDDLLRVAQFDPELDSLLTILGLKNRTYIKSNLKRADQIRENDTDYADILELEEN